MNRMKIYPIGIIQQDENEVKAVRMLRIQTDKEKMIKKYIYNKKLL